MFDGWMDGWMGGVDRWYYWNVGGEVVVTWMEKF